MTKAYFRPRLVALALGVACSGPAAATTYHVSASGDDAASGADEAAAWETLARASRAELRPGDRLLLRRGDRFEGQLRVDARGEVEREIEIGAWGEGPAPIVDGGGADAAVRLVDPGHLAVRGLEIRNAAGLYGVRMTARDAEALGPVTFESLDIHDVCERSRTWPEDAPHDETKYYGGLNAQVLRGEEPSWWTGIVVRDCRIHDLGPCGVSIGSDYALHESRRRRSGEEPYPIRGVLIERTVLRDIGRDGAIIRQCDGAVLQHNDVIRTGRVSISNGIWFWDSQRSTIRYNFGTQCGVKGRVDGGPFSIDYYSTDCRIEYNVSRDNEGPGFMAFGNRGTGRGSVIRGNVSINDATAESRAGFAAVSMISTLSETIVEDNIIIAGSDTRVLLGHHDWEGMPRDVLYRRNVFVGNGRARVDASALTGGRFEANVFLSVPDLPEALATDPADAARALARAMEARESERWFEVGARSVQVRGE